MNGWSHEHHNTMSLPWAGSIRGSQDSHAQTFNLNAPVMQSAMQAPPPESLKTSLLNRTTLR